MSVSCTVNKGDFPINITWILNDRPIEMYTGISVLRTNKRISQLSIDSVSSEHSGAYQCVAKNLVGSAEYMAHLRVNGS